MDTRTRILTEKPFKLMISLSLPAIIGMIVIGLYNFMDAVFVGQMVGPEAMTAVKISYPFTLINSGIATLIGVGSASVLSRAIGENDKKTIDKIMGNLIISIVILSIIITVGGIVFTKQLLFLCGAEGVIMDQAAILTLLRQVILYIPLVIILPRIVEFGVKGVFLAAAVTDLGILLLSIIMEINEFRKIKYNLDYRANSF